MDIQFTNSQACLQRQGIDSLFTETSSDGLGTSFWGRVDVGIRLLNSVWDIKPNNVAGLFGARVITEFYSLTANGPTQYHPGGMDLPLPAEPLQGPSGKSYAYVNAGEGLYSGAAIRRRLRGIAYHQLQEVALMLCLHPSISSYFAEYS